VIQLVSGCYIILFKPFEETLINRLEVMNDIITLLLIDLIFLFTPLLDSQVLKYKLGFAFICMLAGCICVHLFFLFSDITKQLIEKIKVWREKWKAR
jgi:glucan phosphoethanolaminetransferase (alkaline phosphatase superfamily)